MTYEERVKHRELVERCTALQERLSAGDPWEATPRGDAAELADLVRELLDQLSPERLDRLMETIADEASRRAGALAPIK